ncbi:MAG: hypothetical protein ACERJ2_17345, partial [Filomicrobium sp.]
MKAIKTPTKVNVKHELKYDYEKSGDKVRVTEESDTISRSAYIGQETPTNAGIVKAGIVHELKFDSEKFAKKEWFVEGTQADDPNLEGTGNGGKHYFYGLGGNDTFYAGRGEDEFHGGDHTEPHGDTVTYENSTSAVVVDLGTREGEGGYAQDDSYIEIENVTGSAHDDTIRGDQVANTLDGGGGNDRLVGRVG